jgi:hypothetical protein
VAPAGVVLGQPKDQRNQVVGEGRTTASTVRLGPLARHQPAVPSQDRGRRHQEGRPASTRKRAAQRREQRAIGGLELGSRDLAAQHLELVAEYGDLDVFGMLALEPPEQDAEESAHREVEEGEGHG